MKIRPTVETVSALIAFVIVAVISVGAGYYIDLTPKEVLCWDNPLIAFGAIVMVLSLIDFRTVQIEMFIFVATALTVVVVMYAILLLPYFGCYDTALVDMLFQCLLWSLALATVFFNRLRREGVIVFSEECSSC